MALTARQIEIQVERNNKELQHTSDLLGRMPPNDPDRRRLFARVQMLKSSQQYWRRVYKSLTGRDLLMRYYVPVMVIVVDDAAVHRQVEQEEDKKVRELIGLGHSDLRLLRDNVRSAYDTAHNSGFANLIFSHWARIFGGADSLTLKVLLDMTLPEAARHLRAAEAARVRGAYREARQDLNQAAVTMRRAAKEFARWQNMVESGAKQAEMCIKFYAAVAAGGAASAYGAATGVSLTASQEGMVAATGAAAQHSTDLGARALAGENITARDLADGMFDVAVSGLSAPAGAKMTRWLRVAARKVAGRIAAKAVARYAGPALGPRQRQAAIRAATNFVEQRIRSLGVSQFQKIANRLAHEDKEPDWTWWENVLAPLVGGQLEPVIKEAARNR